MEKETGLKAFMHVDNIMVWGKDVRELESGDSSYVKTLEKWIKKLITKKCVEEDKEVD